MERTLFSRWPAVARGMAARRKFARAKAEAAKERALMEGLMTKVEKTSAGEGFCFPPPPPPTTTHHPPPTTHHISPIMLTFMRQT
jgi:hypothetical protein